MQEKTTLLLIIYFASSAAAIVWFVVSLAKFVRIDNANRKKRFFWEMMTIASGIAVFAVIASALAPLIMLSAMN